MKGLIALLGSGEYLPVMNDVDRYLLASRNANGRMPRVICLPTAAGQEGGESVSRWSNMGLEHFRALNADVTAASIIDVESANDPQWEPALENADLIYFSGGNPLYLFETLKDSRAWTAARKAWERGAVYAGCSAGAMILAQKIPNFRTAGFTSTPGFQVLPAAFVIPHFDRMRGLWTAFFFGLRRQLNDDEFILGIDENTALVGKLGETWRVMGKGQVHIISRDDQQDFAVGASVKL